MSIFKYIGIVAWSIGYFPFQSPVLHPQRAPFCSFASLYTLIVILLGTFLDFDMLLNRPLLFLKNAPLVMIIIWISALLLDVGFPLGCRLIGVMYGRKFSSAVQDLEKLNQLGVRGGWDWTKFWFYAVLVPQSAFHVKGVVCAIRDHMDWGVPDGDMLVQERILSSIWEPLIIVNNARTIMNPIFCKLVALWVVIWVGLEMRGAHAVVFDLLISTIEQNSDIGTNSANELFENLRRVKEAFKVCGRLIGVYILLVLAFMVIIQTWVIYIWIWPDDNIAIAYEDVYKPVAETLLMVCLGQTLETQIQRKREQLQEMLLAQTTALFRRPQLLLVASHALEWDWSLTAGSLFKVNSYCISGMIGTLTTYTIFAVGLQLDEDRSK